MRVFVTGATGFVGSAVALDLLAAGHQVLALARSADKAAALRDAGAQVRVGDLADVAGLAEACSGCDAVVHTAFNHDFTRFAENCALDARAIAALGGALAGSQRPLLVTSGLARLAPGRTATEQDGPPSASPEMPRRSETEAAALAERGVRAAVVRLAPSVHGAGDHDFVPHLVALARERGVSAYVGEGRNRWPAVHRSDAARIYRLALEAGVPGPTFHAIAEEGIAFRAIAAAIGEQLQVPVRGLDADEARAHFGWFAGFAAMDAPASSAWTRERLGWSPQGPGLLEDIAHAGYVTR